jgi:uncharacterized membrane protein YhaH (DUF805 family)
LRYYLEAFRKYAVFSGRASRSEYWFFVLVNGIVTIALAVIAQTTARRPPPGQGAWFAPAQLVVVIYYLVALLPSAALLVRRLHDTGRSGWWVFASFLSGALMAFSNLLPGYTLFFAMPALALLVALLVFTIEDSEPGSNRYGSNPKEAAKCL